MVAMRPYVKLLSLLVIITNLTCELHTNTNIMSMHKTHYQKQRKRM